MGTKKVRQDARFMGSVTVTSDLTFESITSSSDITISGDLSVAGTGGFTKTLTASSAFAQAVTAVTSSSATLPNYGIASMRTTEAGIMPFILPAPEAGQELKIVITQQSGSSSTTKVRTSSTLVTIISSGGSSDHAINFDNLGESVTMVGLNSSEWLVTGIQAAAFTTSISTT